MSERERRRDLQRQKLAHYTDDVEDLFDACGVDEPTKTAIKHLMVQAGVPSMQLLGRFAAGGQLPETPPPFASGTRQTTQVQNFPPRLMSRLWVALLDNVTDSRVIIDRLKACGLSQILRLRSRVCTGDENNNRQKDDSPEHVPINLVGGETGGLAQILTSMATCAMKRTMEIDSALQDQASKTTHDPEPDSHASIRSKIRARNSHDGGDTCLYVNRTAVIPPKLPSTFHTRIREEQHPQSNEIQPHCNNENQLLSGVVPKEHGKARDDGDIRPAAYMSRGSVPVGTSTSLFPKRRIDDAGLLRKGLARNPKRHQSMRENTAHQPDEYHTDEKNLRPSTRVPQSSEDGVPHACQLPNRRTNESGAVGRKPVGGPRRDQLLFRGEKQAGKAPSLRQRDSLLTFEDDNSDNSDDSSTEVSSDTTSGSAWSEYSVDNRFKEMDSLDLASKEQTVENIVKQLQNFNCPRKRKDTEGNSDNRSLVQSAIELWRHNIDFSIEFTSADDPNTIIPWIKCKCGQTIRLYFQQPESACVVNMRCFRVHVCNKNTPRYCSWADQLLRQSWQQGLKASTRHDDEYGEFQNRIVQGIVRQMKSFRSFRKDTKKHICSRILGEVHSWTHKIEYTVVFIPRTDSSDIVPAIRCKCGEDIRLSYRPGYSHINLVAFRQHVCEPGGLMKCSWARTLLPDSQKVKQLVIEDEESRMLLEKHGRDSVIEQLKTFAVFAGSVEKVEHTTILRAVHSWNFNVDYTLQFVRSDNSGLGIPEIRCKCGEALALFRRKDNGFIDMRRFRRHICDPKGVTRCSWAARLVQEKKVVGKSDNVLVESNMGDSGLGNTVLENIIGQIESFKGLRDAHGHESEMKMISLVRCWKVSVDYFVTFVEMADRNDTVPAIQCKCGRIITLSYHESPGQETTTSVDLVNLKSHLSSLDGAAKCRWARSITWPIPPPLDENRYQKVESQL